jgi:uncharacterized RDD family membrane protein YckC
MASTGDYQVVTPERVNLQYDIAGIGSRGAAILVDLMVQGAIAFVLYIAFFGLLLVSIVVGQVTGGADITSTAGFIIVAVLFIVALFVLTLGYNLIFEIIWNGQTPGKRTVGIRVIRENGYPIRATDAVIRNIVRIVDYLPFAYAIGVFTMLFNGRAKRLGDFAAGTIVVREGPRTTMAFPMPESDSSTTSLEPDDATLVRDFLVRRTTLNPDARRALAARLASALSIRYGLALDADPEPRLERLV